MAITIRIDEFSSPSGIDGSLSIEEQTRFLTFGFDIPLAEPAAPPETPFERIYFIQKTNRLNTVSRTGRIYNINKTNRTFTV